MKQIFLSVKKQADRFNTLKNWSLDHSKTKVINGGLGPDIHYS